MEESSRFSTSLGDTISPPRRDGDDDFFDQNNDATPAIPEMQQQLPEQTGDSQAVTKSVAAALADPSAIPLASPQASDTAQDPLGGYSDETSTQKPNASSFEASASSDILLPSNNNSTQEPDVDNHFQTLATANTSSQQDIAVSNESALDSFPAQSSSAPFEPHFDESNLDWMNTGSPLQPFGNQEPPPALDTVSTETLYDADPRSNVLHAAPEPNVQGSSDNFQSIDANPVHVPTNDIQPSPSAPDFPEANGGEESDSTLAWNVGQDSNTTYDIDVRDEMTDPNEANGSNEPESTVAWGLGKDATAWAGAWAGEENGNMAFKTDVWDNEMNSKDEFDDRGFAQHSVFAGTDSITEPSDEPNIEDAWAQAFADPDSGLDDSWNAAFAQGFDDDGFLELEQEQSSPSRNNTLPYDPADQPATTAANAPPILPRRTSSIGGSTSSYTVTSPVQSNVRETIPSSGPMQFFAELPTTQPVRSRKPRPQAAPPAQPSAPPPPSTAAFSSNQKAPPQAKEPLKPGSSYTQFRRDEKLEMFPAQPSVPVTSYAPPASGVSQSPAPQEQQPQQRYSSTAARYSPAPTASAQASREALPQSQLASRYTALPSQLSAAQTTPPMPQSTTQTPYATHPTPSSRQPSYAKPSVSSGPPSSATIPGPSAAAPSFPSSTPPVPLPSQPSNRFAPRTSSPLAYSNSRSVAEPSTSTVNNTPAIASTARYTPSPAAAALQPSLAHSGSHGQLASSILAPLENQPMQSDIRQSTTIQHIRSRSPTTGPTSTLEQPRSYAEHAPVTPSVDSISVPLHVHRQPDTATDFASPADETIQDPLERWKGSAIFCWGPAGVAVTCLPKHIPRYGGGQAAPKMKPVAGEVKVQRTKELLTWEDQLPPFPGPLKSKAKKKELISWLSGAISSFEREAQPSNGGSSLFPQIEEKILLWKVVRTLVEHDGLLTGNPAVESAVRELLVQGIKDPQSADDVPQQTLSNSSPQPSPAEITKIRQLLLEGNREQAIWHAVDNQLWAHAMLLSSSTHPNIWKQVVQEFVRKDMRSSGRSNQSLAALYQVVAGNWDESIDELVPLSARSGFQMVSTAATPAQSRDAFEGLNKWRETLSLILGNRSADDEKAVVALGKLLAASGRTEASHVCLLFARGFGYFGGYDDPNTNFTLLGLGQSSLWSNGVVDLQFIQLSEAYEFGLSLCSSNSSYYAPHLQAYKLQHAYWMSEHGYRDEALQYCEAIASAMKSTTRLSPYCHSTLALQLDDLQKRLSQSPKDGSSWMSRPTIGKFSSSMGTWFSSFVAGDEAETASTGSGQQSEFESGPFARISGNTPIISRSASQADLPGAGDYHRVASHPSSNSKYSPAAYAPRQPAGDGGEINEGYPPPFSGSPELKNSYSPRQSNEGLSQAYGSPPKTSSFARYAPQVTQHRSYSPQARPDSGSSRPSYEPYIPIVPEEAPVDPSVQIGQAQVQPSSDQYRSLDQKSNGSAAPNGFPSYDPLQPISNNFANDHAPPSAGGDAGYQPSGGYEPPQSSYEPLMDSSYSPPSYQPYEAEPLAEDREVAPEKSIVNDDVDGDIAARAAELQKREKAERDKATDEAFRAAAEADAAQDKASKEKRSGSGWFGGIGEFFGGKKDPSGPTVYRAKLGEENSFYYDTELKKWVNRKGDSSSPGPAAAAAAPPPPKAAPPSSRNVSSSLGLPPTSTPLNEDTALKPPPSSYPLRDTPASGPPSRTATPSSIADSLPGENSATQAAPLNPTDSGPLTSASVIATATPPTLQSDTPSGPPSRPPTSMSNASSIDDLIGVPQARKGGTVKKGKKGQRYVDVMAK